MKQLLSKKLYVLKWRKKMADKEKKEHPMIGIASWLANESRIDEAQTVLKTVHKSRKSSEEDKKVADKMTKELKLKNREKLAKEVTKAIVMRKTTSLKPHPNIEEVMVIKAEDYERIKEDIDQRGIQIPLVIDPNNCVICGITRWKACKELEIEEVPVFEGKFDLFQDLLDYAIRDNVMRRQIPADERVGLMSQLLREKEATVPGRPPEIKGTKREIEAFDKKVQKAIAAPIAKAKEKLPEPKAEVPIKTLEKSYSCTYGKDGTKDRDFSGNVAKEVESQIELLRSKGHTVQIHIRYEVLK
jgi:hypothetical protein